MKAVPHILGAVLMTGLAAMAARPGAAQDASEIVNFESLTFSGQRWHPARREFR
jgi:hypothetical protein